MGAALKTDGSSRFASLPGFREPMRALVSRGQAIDIRGYEVASIDRVVNELQPATLTLLTDARSLLSSILETCETMDSADSTQDHDAGTDNIRISYLPFERAIDATVASKLHSRQAIEQIAFIAQLELRQRVERLEAVRPTQGAVTLLGECDSSLRRIRKALCAVDVTIARVASVPPLLDFSSELQTSLAVRRAYSRFRARVMAGSDPLPAALRTRFRAIGTQIAIVIGWDVYPEMRVRDRLLLREIQHRVLTWLRGGNDATAAAGLRLWQDLAACVEMLSLVNRRQELLEHDAALVRGTLARLASCANDAPVDELTWKRLLALDGLDEELDELLTQPPPLSEQVVSVLDRLGRQFGPSTSAPPPPAGDMSW
jgi:hypothetical protein